MPAGERDTGHHATREIELRSRETTRQFPRYKLRSPVPLSSPLHLTPFLWGKALKCLRTHSGHVINCKFEGYLCRWWRWALARHAEPELGSAGHAHATPQPLSLQGITQDPPAPCRPEFDRCTRTVASKP